MKIIFLDNDGVLNYTNWYVSDQNPGNLSGQDGDIDPLCVDRVLRICKETGAKIVMSSDWRICLARFENPAGEGGVPGRTHRRQNARTHMEDDFRGGLHAGGFCRVQLPVQPRQGD